MKSLRLIVGTACLVALLQCPATAGPILQLYLEGGTYNSTTESWELTPAGSSGGTSFRVWAIGNIAGPGGKGTIFNVRLALVYDVGVGNVQFDLSPSQTGGLGVGVFQGFTDPSVPIAPVHLQGPAGTEGTTPILGDGSSLPTHGEYGPGRVWQEFALGNFDTPDSPYGDFIDSFPTPVGSGAQINVYEVSVVGPFQEHPFTVHFDLYDSVFAGNHSQARFAPFSHDSDADATIVPEPASLSLLATGLLACLGVRLRRRSSRKEHQRSSAAV